MHVRSDFAAQLPRAAIAAVGHLVMDAPTKPAEGEHLMDDACIREGDYAVFDEHGEKKSLVLVKANG